MDYTGYTEFPFPSRLSETDRQLKAAFMALPDERQLELLHGCLSYEQFRARAEAVLSVN